MRNDVRQHEFQSNSHRVLSMLPLHMSVDRFVLVYFLKGSLPWQGLKARNAKRKYSMILERKQAISIQQLCQVCAIGQWAMMKTMSGAISTINS